MKSSSLRLRHAFAVLACAITAPLLQTASADTATTDPVGFITLPVNGTTSGGYSFRALGLTRPVEYQGSAEVAAGNTITDNEATWTTDRFNPAGATASTATYYLEIIRPAGQVAAAPGEGTTYDIVGTDSANKRITLAQSLATGIVAPANFKIRKYWTISAVFGANNESGLQGGSASSADQILLYNLTTLGYDTYYYKTAGTPGWRKAGDSLTPAGETKIYPESGLIVNRQQTSNLSVVLMGAVKVGQTSSPIFTGANVLGNVYASAMTLASSGLYTGNSATGLAGGSSSSADQVLLFNVGNGGYDTYYYKTAGTPGWRIVGDSTTDQASVKIPVGESFLVNRNGAAFDWKAPQHPTSL